MPAYSIIKVEDLVTQSRIVNQHAIEAKNGNSETMPTFFNSSSASDFINPISQALSYPSNNNEKDIYGESLSKKDIVEFNNLSINYFPHNNLNRKYLIYIPKSYDGSDNYPLVLNFHSYDSNAEIQLSISDMRSLPEEEKFILVYPKD